jgi:hypothetical protein
MAEQQISSDTNNAKSKGRVERWEILPEQPKIDYLVGLQQDDANLTIFLRPVEFNGLYLKINFDNAHSLRSAPESLCFNSVDLIENELRGTTFFIVTDSAFVRQFHENSSWAFDDWNITQYAIFTSNFCLDILSSVEPSVSWDEHLPIKE